MWYISNPWHVLKSIYNFFFEKTKHNNGVSMKLHGLFPFISIEIHSFMCEDLKSQTITSTPSHNAWEYEKFKKVDKVDYGSSTLLIIVKGDWLSYQVSAHEWQFGSICHLLNIWVTLEWVDMHFEWLKYNIILPTKLIGNPPKVRQSLTCMHMGAYVSIVNIVTHKLTPIKILIWGLKGLDMC